MKKLIALSMIVVCLGFFSIGCGGGAAPAPATQSDAAAPGTTEAPAEAPAEKPAE